MKIPFFAKEGLFHLIFSSLLAIFVTILGAHWLIVVLFWAALIFVIQFFRDPPRVITQEERAIVSPASGRVISIEKCTNPYYKNEETLKVSIFMSPISVHSNLIPVDGTIDFCSYFSGKFFNAALDKSSLENERNAIGIRTNKGEMVTSVQVAGFIARRILSYVNPEENVVKGQRYGFIRFGSRVDLYLPTQSKINVQLGDRIDSGSYVIGFLP